VGILSAAQNNLLAAESALVAAVTANPQFANARYFLAAVYEKEGNTADALAQLQAVGAMSEENAAAVAPMIVALQEGKNPFPANLLSVSPAPVK
jgi:protein involved in temperature-dependent protein secretion